MTTETVAQVAQKLTGSAWIVRSTGDLSEVLQTTLEGGITLVLEQNLTVPVWAADQQQPMYWTLSAYAPGPQLGERHAKTLAFEWLTVDLTPATLGSALDAMLGRLAGMPRS